MDMSRSPREYMPKARSWAGSLLLSLLLLLIALVVAGVVGFAGYSVLQQVVPNAPVWSALIISLFALIIVLNLIAARFTWIMPWYYLLPALLFLLTFTVFPVVLTIVLAFTDYAGTRNGQLNIASTTPIASADNNTIIVQNARTLNCEVLRDGCNNVRAVIYASGNVEAVGVSLEGNVLTLAEPLPEGRQVTAVALELADIGFRAQFPVTETDGNQLTLGRVPPGAVDLSEVGLQLDRLPLQRTIVSAVGETLTLNEALPTDLEYEAIARYNDFGFVGLRNFRQIMAQANQALGPVFLWNLAFAILTVLINTIVGVFIAVLLNNPNLQLRGLYRTLLIIPWALPNIITIQVWRGFLNSNFGAINRILALLGIEGLDWLGNEYAAKSAILLVNLWLGLPFMMTATLGALSAIPSDVYEAAKIDGASNWQAFWGVTAPLLRTALVPITLTGFAFNFNNFNVIFLLTGGGPATSWGTPTARGTDILISWAYNEAFQAQGGYAYGLGSAISILIFVITLAVSLLNFRVTGALKEESNA